MDFWDCTTGFPGVWRIRRALRLGLWCADLCYPSSDVPGNVPHVKQHHSLNTVPLPAKDPAVGTSNESGGKTGSGRMILGSLIFGSAMKKNKKNAVSPSHG